MMNLDKQTLLSCLFLICFFPAVFAQQNAQAVAREHLLERSIQFEQSASDLSDLVISNSYTTQHNGVRHVYFKQRYNGVEIFNALSGVHVSKGAEGKVFFSTNRFYNNLSERVESSTRRVQAFDAVQVVGRDLGIPITKTPQVLSRTANKAVFEVKALSNSPVPAELIYWPTTNGKLRLAWNVSVEDPRSAAWWQIFVDAENGQILDKKDATIYCTFEDGPLTTCVAEGHQYTNLRKQVDLNLKEDVEVADGAAYNVFPMPVESPIHGQREMLVNPADPIASPFGWHDTNGQDGPEFTITRGNNVHAYRDAIPGNGPDFPEPDGGPELIFDYPYTLGGTPVDNVNASVAQIFYANNYIHDFTYLFGFDEVSGNFQQNNYGKEGLQGDPVRAEAQDGSGTNNANFATPEDGARPRMQMFLWAQSNSTFQVNSPETIAGDYNFLPAAFGPLLLESISGELAAPTSGPDSLLNGCTDFNNPDALNGKIALIDRGDCFFEEKTVRAEAAGAIACIICNNQAGLLSPGDVDSIPDPSIPTIMIMQEDCARIRAQLDSGAVNVTLQAPDFLDSGFDNGIIVHEYGHGISNRLTGGPDAFTCLFSDEQMGEGWSDFFTLALLAQMGENGAEAKSIGTFPLGQSIEGRGIRRQRYSTDIQVNNQTYDDIIGTRAPHDVGEIWAATLWDIYWDLSEQYGFDPDPNNKTAGNNIAIQLVIDGLKVQSCDPGLLDGRDGLLAADFINNNGANECLLWAVFAKRGLGWNAQQGDNLSRNDNIEAFDLNPDCTPALTIRKNSSALIEPGDEFSVTLTINNNKTTAVTDVLVNDLIPTGATLVPGSLNGVDDFRMEGEALIFELGTLSQGELKRISYKLQSDPSLFSNQLFFDDAEVVGATWSISDLSGRDTWRISTVKPFAGERSWFVPNTPRSNDQVIRLVQPIMVEAEQPILRFYHNYNIQPGLDGGLVEISTNGGLSWIPLDNEQLFRKPYTGRVATNTFGLNRQKAYWGSSNGYVVTYADLGNYIGQSINLRYRFSTNEENPEFAYEAEGWYIDNIEVMDMYNYAGEVCLTTAEGDNICRLPEGRGTIVETALPTSSQDLVEEGFRMQTFPNPVQNILNVSIRGAAQNSVQLELTGLNGQVLERWDLESGLANRNEQLDLSNLPKGIYFLKVQSAENTQVEKIVVQ